jgi:amino acid adenylation domain-containing protein
MDGWCTTILIKDMLLIYQYLKQGKTVNLPVEVPYKNYINWLERQDKEKGIRYWKNTLANYESPARIPFCRHNRPGEKNRYKQKEYRFAIDKTLTGKLKKFSNETNVTISTIFQTLWGILLQKYNDTDDVVFGVVVSGRPPNIEGIETMVGLFINTIPLRIKSETGETFEHLLHKVQTQMIQSKKYEFVPLAEIQSASPLKRPLVNHLVIFENYPVDKKIKHLNRDSGPGFSVESVEAFEQTSYDLNIIAALTEKLQVVISYNSTEYTDHAIERIEKHLVRIIQQVSAAPGTRPEEIAIVSGEEKNRLLYELNDTEADYPGSKTIHQLFEIQAGTTPDDIALVYEDQQLTYGELNLKANQLAYHLKSVGIGTESVVGIMLQRSLEMIIGITAVLKAGGAYLPIDYAYPPERIRYVLEDSNARCLLSQMSPGKMDFKGTVIDINEGEIFKGNETNPNISNNPRSIAYIIYTSGSTGRPKGVIVEHYSAINMAYSRKKRLNIDKDDRVLQFTSICFDASVEQILITLFSGAILVLIDKNMLLDNAGFEKFISKHSVTHIDVVPTFLNNIHLKSPYKLKRIVSGGDVCPMSLAKKWNKYCDFHNAYGPTETTVTSIDMIFEDANITLPHLPIGRPINNTAIYLFDKWKKLVPKGLPGELYIGGTGVARGYLNKPELTSEKFIANPFKQGERLYRTGDLARCLPDGNIDFLGRIDQQLKIRGFRIELGEIESQLLNHVDIKDAVIMSSEVFETSAHGKLDREPGEPGSEDRQLCGYIVSNREFTTLELKEYLAKKLPNYMIPSYFMKVEKIPLTQAGKVDKQALNSLSKKIDMGVKYAAPESSLEKTISDIWRDVLGIDKVGVHDNFFDFGGNSLKVIPLANKLNKALGIGINVVELFEYVTIRSLAQYLNKKEKGPIVCQETIERVKARNEAQQKRSKRKAKRIGGYLNV